MSAALSSGLQKSVYCHCDQLGSCLCFDRGRKVRLLGFDFVNWAHGVVVSHPLCMRKALGSIPSVSSVVEEIEKGLLDLASSV